MRLFLSLFILLSAVSYGQSDEEIKKKAEKAILKWASETFEQYDEPRFENFHLSPSPEYYAMSVLREEYVNFKKEIVFNFNEGTSDRDEATVKHDTANIQKKIDELDVMLKAIEPKFDHIEYFLWSNILTDNGLTVYYQHQIKLDKDMNVISYRESSAVGKPENVHIIFK